MTADPLTYTTAAFLEQLLTPPRSLTFLTSFSDVTSFLRYICDSLRIVLQENYSTHHSTRARHSHFCSGNTTVTRRFPRSISSGEGYDLSFSIGDSGIFDSTFSNFISEGRENLTFTVVLDTST